jgi:hypothetical protein
VRKTFQTITDRFAGFQTQCLNAHVDFPSYNDLPSRSAPVRSATQESKSMTAESSPPGVLLHGGNTVGDWTAKQIHSAVLTTFQMTPRTYGLNQLRYDLRKLKGHALLERDGRRYAYRLTAKGVQVALLFLYFHKRLCRPLANSCFHHKPDSANRPNSQLEGAHHKADQALDKHRRPARRSMNSVRKCCSILVYNLRFKNLVLARRIGRVHPAC